LAEVVELAGCLLGIVLVEVELVDLFYMMTI
jgi:hypothetical protein